MNPFRMHFGLAVHDKTTPRQRTSKILKLFESFRASLRFGAQPAMVLAEKAPPQNGFLNDPPDTYLNWEGRQEAAIERTLVKTPDQQAWTRPSARFEAAARPVQANSTDKARRDSPQQANPIAVSKHGRAVSSHSRAANHICGSLAHTPINGAMSELRLLRARNSQLSDKYLRTRNSLKRRMDGCRSLEWFVQIESLRIAALIHDARNILACMPTSAHLIRAGLQPNSVAQQTCLERISGGIRELLDLTARFEQIEELNSLRLQRVDISQLSRQIVDEIQELALERPVSISASIERVAVVGDKEQLRVLLKRLFMGAIRSAKPGTMLRFRLHGKEKQVYIEIEYPAISHGVNEISEPTGCGQQTALTDDPALALLVYLHGGRLRRDRVSETAFSTVIVLPDIAAQKSQGPEAGS